MVLAALAPQSRATTFFNGDFEAPGGGGTVYLNSGDGTQDRVNGWLHGGGYSNSEFYTGTGVWGISANDGNSYVGFGASGGLGGTLSQTFDTIVGQTYLVRYFLATQEFNGIPPTQVATVAALDAINGNALLAYVVNSFNTEAGKWFAGLELIFTANSSSTTLRFIEQSTEAQEPPPSLANGVNWALDSVSVEAVPEPGTIGLVGLGLAALGFIRRCR